MNAAFVINAGRQKAFAVPIDSLSQLPLLHLLRKRRACTMSGLLSLGKITWRSATTQSSSAEATMAW